MLQYWSYFLIVNLVTAGYTTIITQKKKIRLCERKTLKLLVFNLIFKLPKYLENKLKSNLLRSVIK